MIDYIESFFTNPRQMLLFLLMALPGRMLALSAHEFGHAWVAWRCGDPTARMMGRMTLNPLKHLDPVGTVMMLVLGFGYAKPVPVNPRNYRRYRRDDLLVSLAGVTMNLILFLAAVAAMYAWLGILLHSLPHSPAAGDCYLRNYLGARCLFAGQYYIEVDALLKAAPYIEREFLVPLMGNVGATLFRMLGYFVQVNLVLLLFNLIPLPPLDGYHVLDDLVLRNDVMTSVRWARIGQLALLALAVSGLLSKGMGAALEWVMGGVGSLARTLLTALGAL